MALAAENTLIQLPFSEASGAEPLNAREMLAAIAGDEINVMNLGRQDKCHKEGQARGDTFYTAYAGVTKAAGYTYNSWKDVDEFMETYNTSKAEKRWFEQNTGACTLYFDIDCDDPTHPQFKGLTDAEIVGNFTAALLEFIRGPGTHWGLAEAELIIPYVSTACSPKKISYHVTYRICYDSYGSEWFYFGDIGTLKQFISEFQVVADQHGLIFDQSVYTINRNMRILGSHKAGQPERALVRSNCNQESLKDDARLFLLAYIPADDYIFKIERSGGWKPPTVQLSRQTAIPMSDAEYKAAIAILEDHAGDNFALSDSNNGGWNFKRLRPSHCRICKRTHESDNQYAFPACDGSGAIFLYCHRVEKKCIRLGSYKPRNSALTEVVQADIGPILLASQRDEMMSASSSESPTPQTLKRLQIVRPNPQIRFWLDNIFRGDAGLGKITEQECKRRGIKVTCTKKYSGKIWNEATKLYECADKDKLKNQIPVIVGDVCGQLITELSRRQDVDKDKTIDAVRKVNSEIERDTRRWVRIFEAAKTEIVDLGFDKLVDLGRPSQMAIKDGLLLDLNDPELGKTPGEPLSRILVRPRTKDDLFSYEWPVNFTPRSDFRHALAFFRSLCTHRETEEVDSELVDFFQIAMGYQLTAEFSERKVSVFLGADGTNGKGALHAIRQAIMGKAYDQVGKALVIGRGKGDAGAPNASLIRTKGKRVVCVDELAKDDVFDEALVKAQSSGGQVSGRGMGKDECTWNATAKPVINTNFLAKLKEILSTPEKPSAMMNRLDIYPFNNKFQETAENLALVEAWRTTHRDEIFTWMCIGGRRYYDQGRVLGPRPTSMIKTRNACFRSQDTVGTFFSEKCKVVAGGTVRMKASDLHGSYIRWCEAGGYDHVKIHEFGRVMANLGHKSVERGCHYWYYDLQVDDPPDELAGFAGVGQVDLLAPGR